jgi:RNA polymerase sigma-70 factor (ECF subfamily)
MIDDFPAVLRGAQHGDTEAFGLLWRAFNHRLVRYLRLQIGDRADDIASETWIHIARRIDAFSGNEAQFRGWLFTTARRRLIDAHRRNARRAETPVAAGTLEAAPAVDSNPEQAAMSAHGTEWALAALGQLPDDQREVIALRVLGGLAVAEVARTLELSPGNVRVLQHRGLRRLRILLDGGDLDNV